jgi:hypothetical protein
VSSESPQPDGAAATMISVSIPALQIDLGISESEPQCEHQTLRISGLLLGRTRTPAGLRVYSDWQGLAGPPAGAAADCRH